MLNAFAAAPMSFGLIFLIKYGISNLSSMLIEVFIKFIYCHLIDSRYTLIELDNKEAASTKNKNEQTKEDTQNRFRCCKVDLYRSFLPYGGKSPADI